MWKLTIEDDEGQRTTLELSHEDYSIGRAEDASIRLTERNVSRRHALIKMLDDHSGWVIEDCQSHNGTYLNGERLEQPVPLNSGDTIQLGDYRIELVDQQVTVAPDEESPRKLRPDRLVMVIGPVPGSEFPLNQERLSVGRAEEATISINHASVSRMHCELVSLGQGRWEVVDQGSANGIRINGVELRRGIIEPGDAFELGDVRLRYVAAGKYFRPGADMSQQLPVVVPFESMTPAATTATAPSQGKSIGMVFAIGAGVAVVLIVAAFFVLRPNGSSGAAPATSSTSMAQSEEEASSLFKDAQKMTDKDIEAANKILARIPSDSPLRESAEFKAIKDKWAEHTADAVERRRILNAISEDDAVSEAKRRKAASMAPDTPQPIDLDQTGRPTATAAGSTRPAVSATAGAPNASASSETPPPPPDGPTDKFDQKGNKGPLLSKMRSGRATQSELIELKAICSSDGDRACRNEAVAALKRLQNK
jgi:pSer/pThr/pTyr-binding forkhead associated (FHA) protein